MNRSPHTAAPIVWALALSGGLFATAGESPGTRPVARSCFSAVDAVGEGVLIWGGARFCGTSVVADTSLWLWNGRVWRAREGPPVQPREDALLVPSPTKGSVTLFGGRREGKAFDDLWVYKRNEWHHLRPSGGPGPIQHGAAALDPRRARIVYFGGAVGSALSPKTYEWDGERWHEFSVPGPTPRVGHGMAWWEQDGSVLLYGGFSDRERYRDLWSWNGSSWKLLTEHGPTYTEGPVVAEADRGIYIVGPGLDDSLQPNVRTWRWDGKEFVSAGSAKRPPFRIGAGAVYDRARRVLVLSGGSTESGEADPLLWEFDGLEWRDRTR